MRNITELSVLLRARSELPADLKLKTDTFREGWNFVQSGGAPRLEKKMRRFGWHLIRTTDGSRQGGVGETSQQAIARALQLALRRTNQYFNGVEVGRIQLTTYPWFVLARVGIHLFRIQQSPVQSIPNHALPHRISDREKRLPAPASWLHVGPGWAIPLLKQASPESPPSEAGPQ